MSAVDRLTRFSPCRQYRYTLWREWGGLDLLASNGLLAALNSSRYLMVIGLNPSTADETKDDPTIRRCIGFAKAWGFGALCMTNLFAWRDTDPEQMKRAPFPVGVENDHWLGECAKDAGMILGAWGKHGSYRFRAKQALAFLPPVHCLKRNKDGSPMHPLYVAAKTQPFLL